MSKLVIGLIISPCISDLYTDVAQHTTNASVCPNTVQVVTQTLIDPIDYAKYRHEFSKLKNVGTGDEVLLKRQ